MSIHLKEIDINFKSSRDHSKWAVAVDDKANKTWICVGDINRAVREHIFFRNILRISYASVSELHVISVAK